jgi:hypothetical protein
MIAMSRPATMSRIVIAKTIRNVFLFCSPDKNSPSIFLLFLSELFFYSKNLFTNIGFL